MIPQTIVTNKRTDALNFVQKLQGKCIYKTLLPHVWENSGNKSTAIATASCVEPDVFSKEKWVESCPVLLQQYIEKKCDVRIVVMGMHKKAVYFNSISDTQPVDWRPAYQKSEVEIIELSLPTEINEKIDRFMKEANITFGSFDFSVDTGDNWYFLEINTQGQFLWLDTELELGLLENFSRFLISKSSNYLGKSSPDPNFSHVAFSGSEFFKELAAKGSEPQEDWFYTYE